MRTIIKNINIISPYEIISNFNVVVKDGKITEIGVENNVKLENTDLVIDGKGNYLAPGFIDIHNHGSMGYDVMDSTKEAIDRIGEFHIKNGITSYLGTVITSSYDNMTNAIKNLADYEDKGKFAQLIGIHLEGPFFALDKKGAQSGKYIKEPDMNEIKGMVHMAKGKLKMVSIAPEIPKSLNIISYLKSKEITVGLAHSNANFLEAKRGIDSGATVANHLYNGMRPFNHREPGIIGAMLVDERVYCEIIYDGVHLHDAAVEITLRMKGIDKVVLVSDAMRAAGLGDGDYELGGQRVIVHKNIARLETGNLAGSTLSLRQAVCGLMNNLNISMKDAIYMASLSPAKAIGIGKYKGSIEIGKDADLILIDKDINILGTMTMGKLDERLSGFLI